MIGQLLLFPLFVNLVRLSGIRRFHSLRTASFPPAVVVVYNIVVVVVGAGKTWKSGRSPDGALQSGVDKFGDNGG